MTPEELNKLLAEAANPDKAPAALAALRDGVTALITTSETMRQAAEADKATIAELRDTNMRLFLRTGSAEPEEPQEESLEDYNKRIAAMIRGEDGDK